MKGTDVAWKLREIEMSSVTALCAADRYAYFVKKVADENRLWSLWKDGWVLALDEAGRQVIPVWPHQNYAVACSSGDWSGHTAKEIDLDVWIKRWLPGIKKDNRLIAVFPTPDDKGAVVESGRIGADLEEEMSNYN
jgi:Protein of unknown function (DUF2750)